MTSGSSGGSLIGKIGSYLQIIAQDPSSTAFVPLAEAYRQIGLLDDALEAVRLGTTMLPHFSPGFSSMGRILGQMGRIDEAMSAYARALSMDRQSQSALVGLARLHLIRGERDQARRILKQAQTFHPGDEKISDMLIALDLPRPWADIKPVPHPQAAPVDDLAPGEPGAPIPTATLAEIYVKQGLLDSAIRVYEEIIAQNPGNASAVRRVQELRAQAGMQAVSQAVPPPVPAPDTAAVPFVTAAEEPQPVEVSARRDQSPLAVLQRWLSVIQQGRANVH